MLTDLNYPTVYALIAAMWAFFSYETAVVASNKGRNFGHWWLYGSLVPFVSLIHARLVKSNPSATAASSAATVKGPDAAVPRQRSNRPKVKL